jgi:hypothetical protein
MDTLAMSLGRCSRFDFEQQTQYRAFCNGLQNQGRRSLDQVKTHAESFVV